MAINTTMRTIQSQVGTSDPFLGSVTTLRRADACLQLPEPERNGWPAAAPSTKSLALRRVIGRWAETSASSQPGWIERGSD
jgi:hypothetical protein